MDGNPPKATTTFARPACTECQRRKQKCNREWPCNHCQKRKVADKCRFNSVLDEQTPAERKPPVEPPRLVVNENDDGGGDGDGDGDDDDDDDDADADLEALGYSAAHFLSLHNPKQEKKLKAGPQQYYRLPGQCSQLDNALQVLPPRPYTDSLIQNFINVVNFHHYIVHPSTFLNEYEQWWIDRYQSRPLALPWTALLLTVCACSALYPDPHLQEKLERDLGQKTKKLSEKYHAAGREVYHAIPVGNSHLHTVQHLLHSCYWFNSEARYVEGWHALTAGIREAQELGLHQESIVSPASESDREMRRRAWCLLSIWDWQVGSLLSRPLIMDPSERDFQLPNPNLEEYNPSPVLSTKLQADIVWTLCRRFGRPSNVTTVAEVEEYKLIVESWMQNLPQPYSLTDPDKTMDSVWPWIALHRHYLHTMCMSTALDPLRPYLAKTMSRRSPAAELCLRRDGVKYALKLTSKLYEYFRFLYPKDAKFQSVLFYTFDTAALLCSAALHDGDQTLPRRDDCFRAIFSALDLLKRLHPVVPSAKKPYEMLSRLAKRVSKLTAIQGPVDGHHRKKVRTKRSPGSHTSPASQNSPLTHSSPDSHTSGVSPTPSHNQFNHEPTLNMMSSCGVSPEHVPGIFHDTWNGWMPNMQQVQQVQPVQQVQSASPQYLVETGSAYGPSPSSGFSPASGISGVAVDTSFILSASPNDQLQGLPVTTDMPYDAGVMMAPEEQFQDYNFGNITEADLGTLAGLWNYNSLNLDFVAPYPGP